MVAACGHRYLLLVDLNLQTVQSVPQPDETLSQLILSDPCIFWSPIVL